jgi:hypothetical protein
LNNNAKLIFEMPEVCIDCKASYIDGQHRPGIVKVHCIPLDDDCPERGIHENCPLIETDEKENC